MDHAEKIRFRIREDSWIARVAAYFLKGKKVAIVIGHTIYLHGAKEAELKDSISWFRHELMHIMQYKKKGTIVFILKYLWESCRRGYRNNRYEAEARTAEAIVDFEKKFKVVSR